MFPPLELVGDFGLLIAGASAVQEGTRLVEVAEDAYVARLASARAVAPVGRPRHFANPNDNAFVKLTFYQLVQDYLSIITCTGVRVAGANGNVRREVGLNELDELPRMLAISPAAWPPILQEICDVIQRTAPELDFAGRAVPLVEDGPAGLRERPATYLKAADSGEGEPATKVMRAAGYDPAGVVLSAAVHAVPIPGAGVAPEVIPSGQSAEVAGDSPILLTEER
jgi:hypothetical protein